MKEKDVFKKILWLVFIILLAILVIFYTEKVGIFLTWLLAQFKVVLIGIAIAFVINIPTKFFERILTPKKKEVSEEKGKNKDKEEIVKKEKYEKRLAKGRRIISLLLAIMCILLVIALVTTFIVPEMIENIKGIANNIPSYIESIKKFANEQKDQFGVSNKVVNDIVEHANVVLSELGLTLKDIVAGTFKFTTSLASGLFNFIVSFMLSIYVILDKERLCLGLKKVIYAFLSKNKADYVAKASKVFNKTYTGFVTGQVTEAIILGVLCYIGMLIFKMEYAAIISICIGVASLVPIFGAFIGAVPGVFILLMINPMKAVWFVVYIIILQQIEGNLIYPRVVGTSIGISGFWVLVALIVGGNMGGILGILIGIPGFAAVYILFKDIVKDKLKANKIEEKDIEVKVEKK